MRRCTLYVTLVVALVLVAAAATDAQSFTFYGNGFSLSIGPSSCGGWRPYCPPPPCYMPPPPCGGRGGWNYAPPPPRRHRQPYGGSYYSAPPIYGFGGYGGGYGPVYDEAYQRRLGQLERDRQYQLERAAREAARNAAERDFQFYGSPYRGW